MSIGHDKPRRSKPAERPKKRSEALAPDRVFRYLGTGISASRYNTGFAAKLRIEASGSVGNQIAQTMQNTNLLVNRIARFGGQHSNQSLNNYFSTELSSQNDPLPCMHQPM